ncbi:MAG: hypothetical protein LBM17_04700 [Candidatus Accumulibacter sp.]|nr:hypothetical protein [Accumulibacter sp.]
MSGKSGFFEMKDIQSIQAVLLRIEELLRLGEMHDWADNFKKLQIEIAIEPSFVSGVILSSYGGMGSFNDIVLHKSGVPLDDENIEFSILRSRLYELCHAV